MCVHTSAVISTHPHKHKRTHTHTHTHTHTNTNTNTETRTRAHTHTHTHTHVYTNLRPCLDHKLRGLSRSATRREREREREPRSCMPPCTTARATSAPSRLRRVGNTRAGTSAPAPPRTHRARSLCIVTGPGGPRADELAPGSTGQTICMI